jgi:hypothetical protein
MNAYIKRVNFVIYDVSKDASVSQIKRRMIGQFMNNELECTWKETAVGYYPGRLLKELRKTYCLNFLL